MGPPWFIWLLLAYNCAAVVVNSIRASNIRTVGRWLMAVSRPPLRFGAVLYSLAGLSLIPLSLWVGHYTWLGHWGPFDFQLNRLLFYAYFTLERFSEGRSKLYGKGLKRPVHLIMSRNGDSINHIAPPGFTMSGEHRHSANGNKPVE